MSSGLWIYLLEAGLALALLAFIVWWTLPRPQKATSAIRDPVKTSILPLLDKEGWLRSSRGGPAR